MKQAYLLTCRCVLLLALFSCHLHGQTAPSRDLGQSSGLAHALVFRIFQDKEHYLWFCTTNGLSRYDGRTFVNYYDTEGLGNNQVMSMTQTADGKLWAATYGGDLHYLEQDKFIAHRFSGPRPRNVTAMLAAGDTLYFIDNISATIFRVAGGKADTLDLHAAGPGGMRPALYDICITPAELLIGTSFGLMSWRGNKLVKLLGGQVVYDVLRDAAGKIWLGADGAVIGFGDGETQFREEGDAPPHAFRNLVQTKDGKLLACSDRKKVFHLDLQQKKLVPEKQLRLETLNNITDVLCDHENNLWFSTYGAGLRCFPDLGVVSYTTDDGLSNNFIRRIFPAPGGAVWLCTYNSQPYISYLRNDSVLRLPFDVKRFSNNIHDAASDGRRMYFALSTGVAYDPARGSFTPLEAPSPISLCSDSRRRVWIGQYSVKDGRLPVLQGDSVGAVSEPALDARRIRVIRSDGRGRVWMGSDSGLFCFSEEGKLLRRFGVAEGLQHAQVTDIAAGRDGSVWITDAEGVGFIAPGAAVCTPVEKARRGLHFTALCCDSAGRVWAGTTSGLYYYKKEKRAFVPFRRAFGNAEVLSLAAGADRRLWVGTAQGLYRIEQPGGSAAPLPELRITSVSVNGAALPTGSLDALTHTQNSVQVELAAVSFLFGEELRFRYFLEGADDTWHSTEQPQLRFSGLAPRAYRLRVKGVLPDGTETNEVTLAFRIAAPFWRSAWFFLLLLAVFSGAAWLLFRRRIAAVRKQAQEKLAAHEKMVELEQQATAAMMHPHFIFNALNSIQNYISKNDQRAAHKYLSQFSKLIRLTLENAYRKHVPLEEELQRLELYLELEKNRYPDKLSYRIRVSDDIHAADARIPSMVIQPFVENALWHGLAHCDHAGLIEISVAAAGPDHLRITISDNGSGLPPQPPPPEEKDHYSLGIRLARERLELLAEASGQPASISIVSGPAAQPPFQGTRVELLIPIL